MFVFAQSQDGWVEQYDARDLDGNVAFPAQCLKLLFEVYQNRTKLQINSGIVRNKGSWYKGLLRSKGSILCS